MNIQFVEERESGDCDVRLDGEKVGYIRAPSGKLASRRRYQAQVTTGTGSVRLTQHRRFQDTAWGMDLAQEWVRSVLEESVQSPDTAVAARKPG